MFKHNTHHAAKILDAHDTTTHDSGRTSQDI
jgi:hypothetical protein